MVNPHLVSNLVNVVDRTFILDQHKMRVIDTVDGGGSTNTTEKENKDIFEIL